MFFFLTLLFFPLTITLLLTGRVGGLEVSESHNFRDVVSVEPDGLVRDVSVEADGVVRDVYSVEADGDPSNLVTAEEIVTDNLPAGDSAVGGAGEDAGYLHVDSTFSPVEGGAGGALQLSKQFQEDGPSSTSAPSTDDDGSSLSAAPADETYIGPPTGDGELSGGTLGGAVGVDLRRATKASVVDYFGVKIQSAWRVRDLSIVASFFLLLLLAGLVRT